MHEIFKQNSTKKKEINNLSNKLEVVYCWQLAIIKHSQK